MGGLQISPPLSTARPSMAYSESERPCHASEKSSSQEHKEIVEIPEALNSPAAPAQQPSCQAATPRPSPTTLPGATLDMILRSSLGGPASLTSMPRRSRSAWTHPTPRSALTRLRPAGGPWPSPATGAPCAGGWPQARPPVRPGTARPIDPGYRGLACVSSTTAVGGRSSSCARPSSAAAGCLWSRYRVIVTT